MSKSTELKNALIQCRHPDGTVKHLSMAEVQQLMRRVYAQCYIAEQLREAQLSSHGFQKFQNTENLFSYLHARADVDRALAADKCVEPVHTVIDDIFKATASGPRQLSDMPALAEVLREGAFYPELVGLRVSKMLPQANA